MHAGRAAEGHHENTVYTHCRDSSASDNCNSERNLWNEWAYACPEVHRGITYDIHGRVRTLDDQNTRLNELKQRAKGAIEGTSTPSLCRIDPDIPLEAAAVSDNKLCITSIQDEISTIMTRGPRRFINGILNRDKNTPNATTGIGAEEHLQGRGGFPSSRGGWGNGPGMTDTNYQRLADEYSLAIELANAQPELVEDLEVPPDPGVVAAAEKAAADALAASRAPSGCNPNTCTGCTASELAALEAQGKC